MLTWFQRDMNEMKEKEKEGGKDSHPGLAILVFDVQDSDTSCLCHFYDCKMEEQALGWTSPCDKQVQVRRSSKRSPF